MEYIKHWVVGDQTYGTPGKSDNLKLTRQFLHSYFVEFEHPRSGQTLEFMAPLPKDLQDTIAKLADRRIGLTQRGREVLTSFQARLGFDSTPESFALL
jgi:23S rRNA pseudouridine1911/1915/1917 synthase